MATEGNSGWRIQERSLAQRLFTALNISNVILNKPFQYSNAITNPRRVDIFRFYFLFLKVHPFADSNGTTSAVLADALCAYHGLALLLALNVRFKDNALLGSLCAEYEEVRSEQALTNLLGKFDAFNRAYPIEMAASLA